jgi:pilus assembly protein CpaF
VKDLTSIGPHKELPFEDLLNRAQEYMSKTYSDIMSGTSSQHKEEMQNRIRKYLNDSRYSVKGMDDNELINLLYNEMSLYSFLTPYLNYTVKNVEDIEIPSWDAVFIKKAKGELERTDKHFISPDHAVAVLQRLLNKSSITFDNSNPLVRGYLDHNIRITVNGGFGTLDKNVGISGSIRFVNPGHLDANDLIGFGTLSPEMLNFLFLCYRYGRSMILTGETDAGKTTLMSILMSMLPNNKKLITIENGDREFDLVKRNTLGEPINMVVHEIAKGNITQRMLLEHAMTMNPDFLCMAEIKGDEALAAIEASRTGHPVLATTHSDDCEGVPDRLMELASLKGYNLSDSTLIRMTATGFPIIFHAYKDEVDGVRRVDQICECLLVDDKPVCNPIWEFVKTGEKVLRDPSTHDVVLDPKTGEAKRTVEGYFHKAGNISANLQKKLKRKMPEQVFSHFMEMEGDSKDASHRANSFSVISGRDSDSAQTLSV